ncbi:MAG: hypothetical protein M3R04_02885 [bacterium]|nr:hypothetical protein [bacterium]
MSRARIALLIFLGIGLSLSLGTLMILRGITTELEAEVYSGRCRETIFLWNHPVKTFEPVDGLQRYSGLDLNVSGYDQYSDISQESWIPADSKFIAIMSGLEGMVQTSQYWGYAGAGPGRTLSEQAKQKLVLSTISLWERGDVDAAGNYFVECVRVTDPYNRNRSTSQVHPSELPDIGSFMKSYVPNDEWIQWWGEG